jgi:hypothetical protein
VSLSEPVDLPGVWVGIEELPVQAMNAAVCQLSGPGEIVLTVGQFSPPILAGTPEEQAAQARALPFAQIRRLARFGLTPTRARELIAVLTTIPEGNTKLTGTTQ